MCSAMQSIQRKLNSNFLKVFINVIFSIIKSLWVKQYRSVIGIHGEGTFITKIAMSFTDGLYNSLNHNGPRKEL